MGKSTINVPCSIAMLNYQRVIQLQDFPKTFQVSSGDSHSKQVAASLGELVLACTKGFVLSHGVSPVVTMVVSILSQYTKSLGWLGGSTIFFRSLEGFEPPYGKIKIALEHKREHPRKMIYSHGALSSTSMLVSPWVYRTCRNVMKCCVFYQPNVTYIFKKHVKEMIT